MNQRKFSFGKKITNFPLSSLTDFWVFAFLPFFFFFPHFHTIRRVPGEGGLDLKQHLLENCLVNPAWGNSSDRSCLHSHGY